MAKIGRNEPCPCNSGKKYKHCHGAAHPAPARPAEAAKPAMPLSQEARLKPMGMPGVTQHLIGAFRFRDPADPRNLSGPAGLAGKYKVTFVLNRPGYALLRENEHSFVSDNLKGDSHLAISRPAFVTPQNENADHIRVYANTSAGQFEFDGYPNERGFLGKLVLESVDALGFDDAELKAYRALAPTLSVWSIQRDIPLRVFQIDSTEISTGNSRTSFVTPWLDMVFAVPPQGTMTDEFRRYASLYREALNSDTPAYQFLCFFKIIEGVQGRRARMVTEARSRGEEPKRYDERLPTDHGDCARWLNAVFYSRPPWDPMTIDQIFLPEVHGKKLSHITETQFRPLRVRIAHAILDSGEPTLLADEGLDLQKLIKWLPLAKCITRRMLKNEFPADFLHFVAEDGSVRG